MDMKISKKYTLNGYFTVEASFLLPMVLLFLALVLYTGFFLYQRCLLTVDGYRLAVWIGIEAREDSQQQIEGAIKRVQKDLIGTKYNMGKKPEIRWEIKNLNVLVTMKGLITVWAGKVFGTDNFWEYHSDAAVKAEDPVQILRNYRRMIDIGSKIVE